MKKLYSVKSGDLLVIKLKDDYVIIREKERTLNDPTIKKFVAEIIKERPLTVKIREKGTFSSIENFTICEKDTTLLQKEEGINKLFHNNDPIFSGLKTFGINDNLIHEIKLNILDIHSKGPYPSYSLSNFAKHKFLFYDIECASMEGLLQSFTEENPRVQIEICQLIGKEAKIRGRANREKWQKDQTLWWQGTSIDRHSYIYQDLLDEAYKALSKNIYFRKALLRTGNTKLIHSIGTKNPMKTILTEKEFCSRLIKLRTEMEKIYRGK